MLGVFFSLPRAGRVVCAPAQSGWGIEPGMLAAATIAAAPGFTPSGCCAATSPSRGRKEVRDVPGRPLPPGEGKRDDEGRRPIRLSS